MGMVYANIVLSNPVNTGLQPVKTSCLVDSGSVFLCIPPHIASQLQIQNLETRPVTLADGSVRSVPYAGPVKVNFSDRSCFVGALIMGTEVLLAAVPMEDMDLVVEPKFLRLSVKSDIPRYRV
jgi:clan AA aspartic protease